MLSLLSFQPADRGLTEATDLADIWQQHGGSIDGSTDDPYRAGRWHCDRTGAQILIDLGSLPLEHDPLDEEKQYPGWQRLPMHLQIPLCGPHWLAVEALACIEQVLADIPEVAVLDAEDPRPADEVQPGQLDRLACLDSWERQMSSQLTGRDDLPRMARLPSVALWRYRKQRPVGGASPDEIIWPEALVLNDQGQARAAAFWSHPDLPLALPPVELLVIQRERDIGVLPADELIIAAKHVETHPDSGATIIPASDQTHALHAGARLLPLERFRACGGEDWTDCR
jgi:hypothetical protein